MSKKKGARTTLERKLEELFELANSCGEGYLSSVLINVSTVYISGDKDMLAGLALATHKTAQLAANSLHRDLPKNPLTRDPLDERIEAVANTAHAAQLYDIAATMLSLSSLYTVGNAELIRKLAEAAKSMSSEGVGRRPEKVVLLVENTLEEYGPDPKRKNEGFMDIDF